MASCATVNTDEFEYRDAENAIKWEECQRVYRDRGIPTLSYHHHQRGAPHKPWDVREDLSVNQCDAVLGEWD